MSLQQLQVRTLPIFVFSTVTGSSIPVCKENTVYVFCTAQFAVNFFKFGGFSLSIHWLTLDTRVEKHSHDRLFIDIFFHRIKLCRYNMFKTLGNSNVDYVPSSLDTLDVTQRQNLFLSDQIHLLWHLN